MKKTYVSIKRDIHQSKDKYINQKRYISIKRENIHEKRYIFMK